MVVHAKDEAELLKIIDNLEGQLTATLIAQGEEGATSRYHTSFTRQGRSYYFITEFLQALR